MAQGELDHLADFADLAPEAADVLVIDFRDFRLFLFHRFLGDLDVGLGFDEDRIRAGRERRDDEVELASHDAHADHVAPSDCAALQDLRHVLLAAHDSDCFGRGERHFLRGTSECLAKADLVVDPDAGVPALHPVHPDYAAVRVFGISSANPGGGGLRAFDEDDVTFLQLEDLHDLGVDAHDPAPRIRGLRHGEPEELHAAGGHFQRVSSRGGTARAALAGLRNESALLELMTKPQNENEKGQGPRHSTGTLTGFGSGVGSFFGTRTSRMPSFSVAEARSALTSSGKLSTRWRAWYVRSRYW